MAGRQARFVIASLSPVPELSPDARRLIVEAIGSVELLEVLLLLSRSPDTFWTAEAVAQRLGMSGEVVKKALQSLAEEEFVSSARDTVAYRYDPPDERRRAGVAALAEDYANQLINVINAIYSARLDRLRAFSDSFKLKKG